MSFEDEHFEDEMADIALSVHARRRGNDLEAYVYVDSEIVFTHRGHMSRYPSGLEDFKHIAVRRFAQRLAEVLDY